MERKFKAKRWTFTIIAVVIVVAAVIGVTVIAFASSTGSVNDSGDVSTNPTPPPWAPPKPEVTPPMPDTPYIPTFETDPHYGTERMYELKKKMDEATTIEEKRAIARELEQERIKWGGTTTRYLGGPETRGTETCIAGKTVKLPDDAELGGFAPLLPHSPQSIIRGNSVISIGVHDGTITGGRIAPGEEGIFDFLKEIFPDQSDAIDALPVGEPSDGVIRIIPDEEVDLSTGKLIGTEKE